MRFWFLLPFLSLFLAEPDRPDVSGLLVVGKHIPVEGYELDPAANAGNLRTEGIPFAIECEAKEGYYCSQPVFFAEGVECPEAYYCAGNATQPTRCIYAYLQGGCHNHVWSLSFSFRFQKSHSYDRALQKSMQAAVVNATGAPRGQVFIRALENGEVLKEIENEPIMSQEVGIRAMRKTFRRFVMVRGPVLVCFATAESREVVEGYYAQFWNRDVIGKLHAIMGPYNFDRPEVVLEPEIFAPGELPLSRLNEDDVKMGDVERIGSTFVLRPGTIAIIVCSGLVLGVVVGLVTVHYRFGVKWKQCMGGKHRTRAPNVREAQEMDQTSERATSEPVAGSVQVQGSIRTATSSSSSSRNPDRGRSHPITYSLASPRKIVRIPPIPMIQERFYDCYPPPSALSPSPTCNTERDVMDGDTSSTYGTT